MCGPRPAQNAMPLALRLTWPMALACQLQPPSQCHLSPRLEWPRSPLHSLSLGKLTLLRRSEHALLRWLTRLRQGAARQVPSVLKAAPVSLMV